MTLTKKSKANPKSTTFSDMWGKGKFINQIEILNETAYFFRYKIFQFSNILKGKRRILMTWIMNYATPKYSHWMPLWKIGGLEV